MVAASPTEVNPATPTLPGLTIPGEPPDTTKHLQTAG